MRLKPKVPCKSRVCQAVYCSKECRTNALAHGHALLCRGSMTVQARKVRAITPSSLRQLLLLLLLLLL
jgi:hypothetical protein